MPKIDLMISATDANDVWHDYIRTFEGAITAGFRTGLPTSSRVSRPVSCGRVRHR